MIKYNNTGCKTEYRYIRSAKGRSLKIIIIRPENALHERNTGVLWLHGGGYLLGFPEMAFMSRAADLVTKCGATVICPNYRMSLQSPYPAALSDSYRALLYMKDHAAELGIRDDQIMVGGESAGGGLAAALCMLARDKGKVNIAFQMPLYPMLDCEDTESSANNHNKVWNTARNHLAWKLYLRSLKGKHIPQYASPSRCKNYSDLPPAYTYVWQKEPFYRETEEYINNLKAVGIYAKIDIYPDGYHALDMMEPDNAWSKLAEKRFCEEFTYAKEHFFAKQDFSKV
jgi:acetyl esterase/lipase